jgi:O-6-methylguanine DNA methyltransferase
VIETPLGPVVVRVDDAGAHVVAIDFAASPPPIAAPVDERARDVVRVVLSAHRALVDEAERQLRAYFAGALRSFDLPCAAPGTEYQRRVWARLAAIPFGVTATYGALAAELGSSARAVGTANGANPIAIVVPCHRVIGKSGALTGYAGGLPKKRWLLVHEGAALV